MKIYFLFVTLIVVLIGCNTPSSTTSIETISEDSIKPQGIKRGIINVLSAVTDASCNYALFVPNDSCNAYPLIVIFDPHAAGNHATSQYKELAGKYNVVLAASNKIQNNMPSEEFMYFASCIIDDVMQKIPIDSAHVYLMGFSGGARVASFLAQQENIFKGVIGCGAGLTDLVNIKIPDFLYVGMAGFSDFNFPEVYKSENTLRQSSVRANFKYFDGKHEWPPDSIMEYAFIAITLNRKQYTKEIISSYLTKETNLNKKIPVRDAWKKVIGFKSLKDLIETYNGFEVEKLQINSYLDSYEAKMSERNITSSLTKEFTSQTELQKAFAEKDIDWWNKKIKILSVAIGKKNKTPADYRDIRLLNYISIAGYTATSQALKSGDIKQAEKFLNIYRLADPSNPDMIFLTGVYLTINKEYQSAIDSLTLAVQMGFSDKRKWQSERSFIPLKDSLRFIDLEAKLNSMP